MKKSIAKRVLSLFLAATVLVGIFPTKTEAAQPQANAESSDYEVRGTNSFGNLVSSKIEEQQAALAQEESEYSGGYAVVGLSIDGNVATVEYSSLEEAVLVVSLYTEDGLQMLLSQNTTVDPDGSIATLTFNDDVPEYFVASAYLLDSYDYSPLCVSYSTPMYTREMQELLASTVDDYDADRVLNLGGDNTTNFAVYEESTIVIEAKSGVNTVSSIDEQNATYVIENIDENIAGLQPGDVFAYPYGENEILIVKVASITVSGTVATITGDELEIEEVFSHLKLESTGTTGDLTVDEATCDEGVSYVGKITDGAAVMSMDPYGVSTAAVEDDVSGNLSLGFKLEKKTDTFTLKGSLALDAKVSFSFYISTSRQYVEFKADINTALSFSFKGESSLWEMNLASMGFSPVPSVRIGFKPKLVLKISAELETSLNVGFTKGFSYENGIGITDLSTAPKVDLDLDAEGTIFFGLDLAPQVSVLDGWVAEIKFKALVGVELKAEMNGTNYDNTQIIGGIQNPESIHTCESCLSVELIGKGEFSVKLDFLKFIDVSIKLSDTRFKIGACYYSFTEDDFGWGSCPYESYRVAVHVQDSKGAEISGANVIAVWAEQKTEIPMGTTNSNGTVVDYLPAGTYTFKVALDGETLEKEDVEIEEACKITLNSTTTSKNTNSIPNSVNPEKITDKGVIASGECGAEGANVTWTLYSSGLLEISGDGGIEGEYIYDIHNDGTYALFPWDRYSEYIVNVVIKDGVTSIGDWAFWDCNSLTSITIPASVTSITGSAFPYRSNLQNLVVDEKNLVYTSNEDCVLFNKDRTELIRITGYKSGNFAIPDGVTSIGDYSFYYCKDLTSITIPDGVSSIGEWAFYACDSLACITIPNSITSIGDSAFCGCSNLTSITIPDSVTSIGNHTFSLCTSLTSVTISDSVTSIGKGAFSYCSGLTSITIPDSVTSIGEAAFYGCDGIYSITISDSVTSIDEYAFCDCSGLTSVTIPDSVTRIGHSAFLGCSGLTALTIGNSVTSIGDYAFCGCSNLTSITIPDSVTSIGISVFNDCSSLTGIWVNESNNYYYSDENGVLFNKQKTELVVSPVGVIGAYIIPDSVTRIGDYAFYNCTGLTSITIPDSVSSIADSAFRNCTGLTSITIPDSVTSIGSAAFYRCTGLTSITIPDSVTSIVDSAFSHCASLTSITIPDSVTTIGEYAFCNCSSLTDVYYEGNEEEWNSINIGYDNYFLTAANIHYGDELLLSELQIEAASVDVVTDSDKTEAQDPTDEETEGDFQTTDQQDAPTLYSIYDGEYSTEITDEYMLKTASFAGLVPGEEYLLLALVSIEGKDVLAPDNLLYIDQDVAAEDGTLVFTYVQRVATDTSYVMACGASHNDLSDATVTFPIMTASEEVKAVKPVVTYGEKQLIEGVDYVVVGTVDYSAAGEYTCYIRGIYDYSGLVKCVYTVTDSMIGDVDGDGEISDWDAILLNRYLAGWNVEIDLSAADIDADGEVSDWDAILLDRYMAGWDIQLES